MHAGDDDDHYHHRVDCACNWTIMYLEKLRSVNHIKHWVRWFHVCPFNCCIWKLFTFILKYATEILLDHLIAMINGAQKLTINTQILWNYFFLFCCKLSAVTFSSSIMRLELCQRNFEIGITPEKFAKIDNNRTSNSCHPASVTKNIPMSLSLRIVRICTNYENLKNSSTESRFYMRKEEPWE